MNQNSFAGIYEWMPSDSYHNFGDFLMWIIGENIFTADEWERLKSDKDHSYILIGSALCDYVLNKIIDAGYTPVMIGCGYRGEKISPHLLNKSIIIGCRGDKTRNSLLTSGVKTDKIGDTALILPLLIDGSTLNSRQSLLIPHICDGNRHLYNEKDIGCDKIIQPEITSKEEAITMIKAISSAEFVLAGALHAAIIAFAYKTPFAFFKALMLRISRSVQLYSKDEPEPPRPLH